MTEAPTARQLHQRLTELFSVTDFTALRDSLEAGASRAESDELLGEFSRFVREAVDPEIVIDLSTVEGVDYGGVFHGWHGWVEFWRRWFESWEGQTTELSEYEELDADRVLHHAIALNRGRSSGAEVSWESWNLWVARNGRFVLMAGRNEREDALAAAAEIAD